MQQIIRDIIRREGGFVDDPDDRGGATNHGITQATLSEHLGRPATRADVENLSEMTAAMIYEERYIKDPHFDRIENEPLRGLVVDCGVNHGPSRAAKWLQQAAKATADGKVGPATLAAVNGGDAGALYLAVLSRRIRFYGQIISNNHSQAKFAAGWLNRAAEFLEV